MSCEEVICSLIDHAEKLNCFVVVFLSVSVFCCSVVYWVIGISEDFEMLLEELFSSSPSIFIKPLKLCSNSLNQFINFTLFTKSSQIFLFKIVFQAIKGRLEIVSDLGFLLKSFFMGFILMKQFSFLLSFVFIVFFILTECFFKSRDMSLVFDVMLFNLFFNCSSFVYFLFNYLWGLAGRLGFFLGSFCFSHFLLTFLLLFSLLFLFFFLLNNLFYLNLLLNILNLLPNTSSINRNINKNILNISNMYRAHHKLNN